jgi:pyridoxal phosphate enzyme (YggS family)
VPRRRDELNARLAQVRGRIARACAQVGRDPHEITLIAVTKTRPVSDVALLGELGLRDVAENRDSEARPKALELPMMRWHFVGQLQRNKAASVAEYADVVHSVDRASLVSALERGAERAGRRVGVLLQVNLDGGVAGGARGGAPPGDTPNLAAFVAAAPHLSLCGVMGIAPLDASPLPAFAQLRVVSEEVRRGYPQARWISAGMSGDLEAAITQGATHVRVGGALLGNRS